MTTPNRMTKEREQEIRYKLLSINMRHPSDIVSWLVELLSELDALRAENEMLKDGVRALMEQFQDSIPIEAWPAYCLIKEIKTKKL